MKLSIIIPCYNEIKTINKIIEKINLVCPYKFEIIVIDDFSTDGSREALQAIDKAKIFKLILNEKNFGKSPN